MVCVADELETLFSEVVLVDFVVVVAVFALLCEVVVVATPQAVNISADAAIAAM